MRRCRVSSSSVEWMADVGDMEIGRWLAEVRAGNEVRVRQRQRWLETQASEQATFVGALTDIAETGQDVVVETSAGRNHTGRIQAVGIDFCALSTGDRWLFVPLRALVAVRSTAIGGTAATGDRIGGLDLTLLEALADQLADRPRLVLWLSSGERVQGELSGVGRDVVTVGLDGAQQRKAHIAAEAISEVGLY